MRKKTNLFLIDGQPMLAPDENMQITAQDIEAADAARDESGFLHRFTVRQNVGKCITKPRCCKTPGSIFIIPNA